MFPWEQVDGLLATKSKGLGLVVRAMSFQHCQHRAYVVLIYQRYRRTDGRTNGDHAIAIPRYAYIVHRTVKMLSS